MEPPEWISGDILFLPARLDRPVTQRDFDRNRGEEENLKKKRLYTVKEKREGFRPRPPASGSGGHPEGSPGPFIYISAGRLRRRMSLKSLNHPNTRSRKRTKHICIG
jgi:hypothetical protein